MRFSKIFVLLLPLTFIGCSQESYYSCQGTMDNGTIQSMVPFIFHSTEKKKVNITLTLKGKEVYLGGDNSHLEVLSRGYVWDGTNDGEIFFTSNPHEDINKQYERLRKLYPKETDFREQLDWENNHSSGGKFNKINKNLTLFKNDNTCYKKERVDGSCGIYTKGELVCSQVKDIK